MYFFGGGFNSIRSRHRSPIFLNAVFVSLCSDNIFSILLVFGDDHKIRICDVHSIFRFFVPLSHQFSNDEFVRSSLPLSTARPQFWTPLASGALAATFSSLPGTTPFLSFDPPVFRSPCPSQIQETHPKKKQRPWIQLHTLLNKPTPPWISSKRNGRTCKVASPLFPSK